MIDMSLLNNSQTQMYFTSIQHTDDIHVIVYILKDLRELLAVVNVPGNEFTYVNVLDASPEVFGYADGLVVLLGHL